MGCLAALAMAIAVSSDGTMRPWPDVKTDILIGYGKKNGDGATDFMKAYTYGPTSQEAEAYRNTGRFSTDEDGSIMAACSVTGPPNEGWQMLARGMGRKCVSVYGRYHLLVEAWEDKF